MAKKNKGNSLYKYTKLEYLESTLKYGIYASDLQQLNDPYEYAEFEHFGNFKVCCLTRSSNAKLMWSHYADGHQGCSIHIALPPDYDSKDCILKRVEYSSKLVSRKNLSTQETASRLYVKDKKWSSEIEVRAVYDDCNHDDSLWSKDDDGKTFFKVDIKAVSFGCMAENKEREYIKALQALKTFNQNHKKQIAVKKYTLSTTKFAFVLDKEFNYLEELKKLTDRTLCST